ncbi:Lamin-C [Orchesella cincta]|uniref:Lamin-C n=1 Tax=Orchesella cincta TaxID=48709 RepID=A0A1D2NID6_ORCCI|nr:Lamin-C [Orchesella cincta]
MSSKSAKRQAASSSTAGSSAQTPHAAVSSSVQSPMTPTRMSRIQEKKELACLNDRLAAYIERNQQLENENQTLSKQVSHSEETLTRNITRIQSSYDKELTDARRVVDETAKEKAKLQMDHAQLRKDFDDLKTKSDKKNKDHAAIQRQLNQLEGQVTILTADLSRATSDRDRLGNERKEFEQDVQKLAREVDELRRKVEQEMMARVEAENQLKARNEELNFKNQLHQEEIVEMRSRRQVEIQEVDGRLQQEYESKLQESIRELRAEYEAQLRANKEELEGIYDTKASDMKAQLKRAQASLSAKQEEYATLQIRLEGALKSSSHFETERMGLLQRIKELEKKSDDDHSRFAKMLEERDEVIDTLVRDKEQLLNEYQDLMDTKVALDNEIAIYRKLLEGEERRLSISPRPGPRGGTPAGGRRATPLRASKKRRYEEETESSAEYDSNSVVLGDVEILEDSTDGKFIRLKNNGDKEVALSGWTLTRKAGEVDTTHKFHRQMKLDSKAIVTVWSADAEGAAHEPPTSIVMKGQKWFTSDQIVTILNNNSGEEQARRETKRLQISHQRKRLGFGGPDDIFHQSNDGEGAQGDRCVIC